ncbi:MAG: esterase-like activity of phytase family protein [Pseudomonadota bacterium]
MRYHRFLVPAVLAIVLSTSAMGQPTLSPGPVPIEVRARALPSFAIGDTERRIFGDLEWIGGLELTSANRHFGALSGISVNSDGRRFTAVTDNGFWVAGTIVKSSDGTPIGLGDVTLAPMLDRAGNVLNLKNAADAESIDRLEQDGQTVFLVAFERRHRIETYVAASDFSSKPHPWPAPAAIRRLRANKGIETVAVGRPATKSDGLVVLIAERGQPAGADIPGWLSRGSGQTGSFSVRQRNDFDVTDAAFLPDGDLMLLERRFNYRDGIHMRLRRIPLTALRPGTVVDGPIVARADFTDQIDNMEGLSVHEEPDGGIVLTLVSDDNRSILQRTLLLQFRLRQPEGSARPLARPRSATE